MCSTLRPRDAFFALQTLQRCQWLTGQVSLECDSSTNTSPLTAFSQQTSAAEKAVASLEGSLAGVIAASTLAVMFAVMLQRHSKVGRVLLWHFKYERTPGVSFAS